MAAELGRPSRVLVIDDQEPNVRLLERILVGAGYDVLGVTDPRTAMQRLDEFGPDLVLLDLHMRHLNGFTLLEQIKQADGRQDYLPVVVLTADVEPAARHRALSLGADDFLIKPFDAQEVLLRARNLLATRKLYLALHATSRDQAHLIVSLARGIDDAQQTRRAILASMARLPAHAPLVDRAKAFLAELCGDPSIDAALLVAFDDAHEASVIAAHGVAQLERDTEWPLAPVESAAVRALASAEPGYHAVEDDPEGLGRLLAGTGMRFAGRVELGGVTPTVQLIAASRGSAHTGESALDSPPNSLLPKVAELGSLAALVLGPSLHERGQNARARREVKAIIEHGAFWPVFQPIVDLRTRSVVGYEALTRFADGGPPAETFLAAAKVGMGHALEESTLSAALAEGRNLPSSAFLSLNASPELLLSNGRLKRLLLDAERLIVVEITEHVEIADYQSLRDAVAALGPQVRIAIDDAGAGFASFRHVLELRPDFVKLDAELVRGIETDPSRQALVVGMRYFAQQTGTTLIAEGLHTEAERAMLESLGIQFGQGYLFARPERALAIAS